MRGIRPRIQASEPPKLYGRFKMSWLQWLRRMMQSSPYSNVRRFAMSTYASNTPGTPCTGCVCRLGWRGFSAKRAIVLRIAA